jgi:thiamine-monophosphate kinase
LCRTSGVGAVIDIARLELDNVFRRCAAVAALDPVELALSGGEDYVLLFALPPGIRPPAALGATSIGTLTSGRGVKVTGSSTPQSAGWDHFST